MEQNAIFMIKWQNSGKNSILPLFSYYGANTLFVVNVLVTKQSKKRKVDLYNTPSTGPYELLR